MIRTLLVSAVAALALVAPTAAEASPDAAPRHAQAQLAGKITGTWTGTFDVTGSDDANSGVILTIDRRTASGTMTR